MGKHVGAHVYNSADISINDITLTALTFNSERFDYDGIHSTVSNTGRLTCQTAGVYLINGNVQWEPNATGRRVLDIRLNGTTFIAGSSQMAVTTAAVNTLQSVSAPPYLLAIGDYVELVVFQASGGALNVQVAGNLSPEFAMVRIG